MEIPNVARLKPDSLGEPGVAVTDTSHSPPLLLEMWQIAQRWRWVIAGIIGASLLAGVIVTMLMTPLFTATTRLEISREERNVTKVDGVESGDFGQSTEFYQTQYSLLKARSVAERVARDQRLARDDAFLASVGLKSDGGGTANALSGNLNEAVIGALLQRVEVNPVRGSSLIDVGFTSANPSQSARIANAWAAQFIESNLARRFAATADARKFLEDRLADLRARLEQSERAQINYASQQGIVAIEKTQVDGKTISQRTLAASDLDALNTELGKATAERISAQSLAQSGAVDASSEALASSSVAPLKQRRAELAAEYARMMVLFEPQYPSARAVQEQIRALDVSIARSNAGSNADGRAARTARLREANARENALAQKVGQLKGQLDSQQRAGIQNNIFQREVDTNRQLYDALLQRYKEIGVAGVGSNNVAIIDSAKIPGSPSRPNLAFNLAFALLLGIALAGVVTLALNQIDEGLRTPNEITTKLGVPLLGSLPMVGEDALRQLSDVKSELTEAYLSILSNLSFSTPHGLPKSMMVTSTRPGEAKSTSALAIAAMIGRSERTALLIDGDMRSPSVHDFTGTKNAAGLSNYLTGDEDWHALIQPTNLRGLSVISAGPKPPNAAELLSGDRFAKLLAEVGRDFDHIVIDCPPILGLADAPLISRMVEGVVFVVQAKGVATRGVRASLSRLAAVNAHIFGGILTKLEHREAAYGYGYGYGYGAGYGYGDETKPAPAE